MKLVLEGICSFPGLACWRLFIWPCLLKNPCGFMTWVYTGFLFIFYGTPRSQLYSAVASCLLRITQEYFVPKLCVRSTSSFTIPMLLFADNISWKVGKNGSLFISKLIDCFKKYCWRYHLEEIFRKVGVCFSLLCPRQLRKVTCQEP